MQLFPWAKYMDPRPPCHSRTTRTLSVGLPLHPIATEMFQDGRTDPGGDDNLWIHPSQNAQNCVMQPALTQRSQSRREQAPRLFDGSANLKKRSS